MQIKFIIKTLIAVMALILAANIVYADTVKMISAKDHIKGLAQVLYGAEHVSTMPALFPTQIPARKNLSRLYASFSSYATKPDFHKFWQINAGATPACKGARFCNVGFVSAERDGKLETTFGGMIPNSAKQPKEPVTLQNGTVAYFTPGHAEGDFHPAMLEWQMNNVLYTLTWNAKKGTEKDTLTTMANSALSSSKN